MESLRSHRSFVAVAALIVGTVAITAATACREQASAQQYTTVESTTSLNRTPAIVAAPAAAEVKVEQTESSGDRTIREELTTAIAHDPALRDRAIRFAIDNGDITVTGTVRTESERQKINELAMQINGVKSVANALHVSPS